MQWVPDALQDLRFAFRLFGRRPGFALLAMLTLAFGVGATTAVYTIVHAVLIRPLPFSEADRLVLVWDNAARDGDQVLQRIPNVADLEEYQRSARSIVHISGSGRMSSLLTYGGVTRRVPAAVVTSGLFHETLGVEAALGRTFTADDERGGCSAVLSHSFWTTMLGADRSLIGRALTLDGTECNVLGVLPPGFALWPTDANLWFLKDHTSRAANPGGHLVVIARLSPGISIRQATAELTALHRPLHANDRGGRDQDERDRVPSVDRIQGELAYLSAPSLSTSLWLTLGAVSLLLLIACLNVANLLLARLSDRQRELVVRAALGSGRIRLVRQVLTESLLLALAGSAAGVAMAIAGVRWFRHLNPVELPNYVGQVGVDLPVLSFAILLSLATTAAFGLLPAIQSSHVDLSQGLKAAGRGFAGFAARHGSAQVMIAVQIAVSFVLLIGAGSLMNSVIHLSSESLGFDANHVVALQVTLPMERYAASGRRTQFYSEILEKIEASPGVESAAIGTTPPFDPRSNVGTERIEIQGESARASGVIDVEYGVASPRSFEVHGTPLLTGRSFDSGDRDGAPLVAIVNEKLAAEYLPGEDPIGRQIRYVAGENRKPWMTIVGVVGTWKHMVSDTIWRDTPMVFQPAAQLPEGEGTSFDIAVRSSSDLPALGREMQRQVAELDRSAEVKEPELTADRLSKALLYPRFRAELLASFSLGALLLAAVGLHGVISQLVSQRIPEFGVRRAVGAQTSDLLLLVVRQGGFPVVIGLAGGIVASTAFGRVLASVLYGIRPASALLVTAASATLILTAALAIAMPASRASRVDPMIALRDE